MNLHKNGPWTNLDGLLYNEAAGAYVQAYESAVGFADDCVLKAGGADMVRHYMQLHHNKMKALGLPKNYLPEITIIEFSNFQILSPDDICTLLNYFLNHIPYDRILEILSMPEDTLREKIASLQKCGF